MILSLNSGLIDMHYDCWLDGLEIHCTITPDRDLSAPVFCFSGMAPMTTTVGGDRIGGMGSFTQVALPDLKAGKPHAIVIEYIHGYKPANRAWLPMGPYLRCEGDLIALPYTPQGCRRQPIQMDEPFDGLPLVPQPTTWTPSEGVVVLQGFRSEDRAFQAASKLAKRRGLGFACETNLQFVTKHMAPDAYEIEITSQGVTVSAADYGGRLYACITLLTLAQHGPLLCGTIADAPRFGWRGQHLDTARHYYQPQTIFDLLDVMALLKLNRFHWHFADDETFRLELDSLPELWQKTRMCGEGELLPALFAGAIRAGGSYSKDTVRAVIAHAKDLNIEVLPEIEAPAHAIAMTHVFPDMRDPADNGAEMSVQGYLGNTMNPAMPKTWEVLEKILAEVSDLFTFDHLHLGCDELAEGAWLGSPKARALMAQEGLATSDDLQGWMMRKLGQIAVDHGQRPAAWEEAAKGSNGGLGHNAILFSWTGQGPGLDAARNGYDVVMTPAQHVYLDMAHTDDADDWGASWAAFISLAETVNWDPVPDPAIADKILGVQGTFWSEFTTQDAQIWPMLLPRMLGVAAMAWQKVPPSPDDICRLAQSSFLQPALMTGHPQT